MDEQSRIEQLERRVAKLELGQFLGVIEQPTHNVQGLENLSGAEVDAIATACINQAREQSRTTDHGEITADQAKAFLCALLHPGEPHRTDLTMGDIVRLGLLRREKS